MNNHNRKFDIATAKKLLGAYAEKINYYMKENTVWKSELEDAKTSLEINKEILFKQLSSSLKDKDKRILITLKDENSRITLKNKELYKEKIDLEKKVYQVQQTLDEILIKHQEYIDKESTETFLQSNRLRERESTILQLKKELEKYYREDFNSTKELIICDPDKVNTEMNNELCETRELLAKYSRLLQDEKRKVEIQTKEINQLKFKIINNKKRKRIKQRMEHIEMFDYILSEDSDTNRTHSDQSNFDCILNWESPIMKFPEKIKQPKYLMTDVSESNQGIPKWDLSKVMKKYTPIHKIDVVENTKVTNRSSQEYIDKLRFQLKLYKNTILKYKKKNTELKNLVIMFKRHLMSINKTKSKSPINSLNNPMSSSTKEEVKTKVTKKSNEDYNLNINDSWNGNTSLMDYPDDDNTDKSNNGGDDFNYIIREYNRTVCPTYENNHS